MKWRYLDCGISLGLYRALDVGSMIGVFASWTMHGNLSHLIGNTVTLLQILFLFGLFEKNAYRTIIKLVIASGLVTWVIGSPSSIHIGASGLCFAMFGYMIGGALFARRWGYLLACIIMGTGYWLTIKQGLMPQPGVSLPHILRIVRRVTAGRNFQASLYQCQSPSISA